MGDQTFREMMMVAPNLAKANPIGFVLSKNFGKTFGLYLRWL